MEQEICSVLVNLFSSIYKNEMIKAYDDLWYEIILIFFFTNIKLLS
jgi:hypothetical protein